MSHRGCGKVQRLNARPGKAWTGTLELILAEPVPMSANLRYLGCQKPIARYYSRRSFTTCAVSSLFRQVD